MNSNRKLSQRVGLGIGIAAALLVLVGVGLLSVRPEPGASAAPAPLTGASEQAKAAKPEGHAFPWHLADAKSPTGDQAEAAGSQMSSIVCGVGRVFHTEAASALFNALIAKETTAIRKEFRENLANDRSPRGQALSASTYTLDLFKLDPSKSRYESPTDETIRRVSTAAQVKGIELAHASDDPVIYAVVARMCGGSTQQPCGNFNIARWSELEPDNALAWLALAERKKGEGSAAGFDAAFARAAKSRSWVAHTDTLDTLLYQAIPESSNPIAHGVFYSDVLWHHDTQLSGPATLLQACNASVPAGTERHNLCQTLLKLAAPNARGDVEAHFILRASERMGYTAPVLDTLRLRRDAARSVQMDLMPDEWQDGNCEQAAKLKKRYQSQFKNGFLNHMEARIKELGLSMEAQAAIEREREARAEARRKSQAAKPK